MQRNRAWPLLGIMVTESSGKLPFASASFYERLIILGQQENLDVFVFSPNRIDWQQHTVTGHTYISKRQEWVTRIYPLPQLIYDRSFFSSKVSYRLYRQHVSKLRERPDIRFLGYGLGSKLEVHRMLQQDGVLSVYLPETRTLTGEHDLRSWLKQRQDVFLKPQGGSQGKGALHLRREIAPDQGQLFTVHGRSARNLPVRRQFRQFEACWQWLHSFIGNRPYLMQQYLSLVSREGTVYDVRSLVQKNERGLWATTGMAVRNGMPGSVTSNLHGGGSAEEVSSFLERQFGAAKAAEVTAELTELSSRIPPVLEKYHGRLAELGIDMGIDTQGSIWILEVNSKPGRTIFARMRNEQARQQAIANPIRYAGFLLHKKLGS